MVAVTFTDAMGTGTTWTSHSTNGDAVEIPNSYLLFNAEFGRVGFDLTLTDDQGHSMHIADYFRHEQSPDLVSPDGAKLTGSVVEKLAGPQFPGQYSQAGEPTGQKAIAIGQVESTSAGSTVKRADGTVEALAEGTKVFQNDVVQTVEGGKLSITFIDGTIFTLASKSRMVLDELVYDPASTENSAVFNLIEGSFVFIAGKAAKSGGMEINTPVATLGIRGTTVKVDIETVNGVSTVDVSLNRDPDGSVGSIVLTDLSGDVIANITAIDSKWIVSPVEGDTREIQRTANEISSDQVIISEAVRAFTKSQQRVNDGGEFVEGSEQSGQETPKEVGEEPPEAEPDQEAVPENGEQAPEENEPTPDGGDQAPEGEQQGNLGEQGGSGLDTASATDQLTTIDGGGSSTTAPLGGDTGQQQAAASPLAPNSTPNTTVADNTFAPDTDTVITPPPAQNAAPVITFPSLSPSVNEDGSIALSGFSISDPEGSPLTTTLTAGSTISIALSTGVTIVSGTGTDDTQLVISGTGQQISDALNSATYKPTPNDDDGGTLIVSVSDGTNTSTQTLVVDIVPSQDAPTALDDTVTRTEDSNLFFGNVTLNDSDPDTTPTPDVLTVQSATDSGTPFGGGTSTGGTAITVGAAQTLTNGGDFTIFSDGQYTFDPGSAYDHLAGGETAVETVDYVINDGNGNIDDATLTINVAGVNDAPVAAGLPSAISADEGQSANVNLSSLSLSDVDANGGDLVVTLSTGTGAIVGTSGAGVTATSISNTEITLEGSVAALNAYLSSTGSGSQVIYTGAANIEGNGADAIAVSVSDEQTAGGDQNISIGSISIDITPGNNPPVAADDSAPAQDDNAAVTGNVLTNDSDPDAGNTLTVSNAGTIVGEFGTLTLNANGNYSYIVTDFSFDAGESSADTFSITVSDGEDSATSELTFNITGTNNAPTISVSNPAALTEGTQGVVSVATIDLATLLNAVDPDGGDTPIIDPNSIVISLNSSSGTTGGEEAFNISGTSVTVDTGIFESLGAGQVGLFDVSFDVVSGPDTSTQTVTITVNGDAAGTINEVTGTANADTLNGTTGNDFILGRGNTNNGDEFLFGDAGDDVLVGTDDTERFDGGEGNDTIITGDNNPNRGDFTQGSNGNDRINYGGNNLGYQGISYGALAAGIVVSIDAAANTATIDKGVNGTDTIIDIIKPLESGGMGSGGFGINGTQFNDTFNLDTGNGTWMQVTGGRGVDTYNIISGTVRLNMQRDENFNEPDNGINVNLATKTIIDDGFGNTETIIGAGTVWEIRGTDLDDIMIGSSADESFIGRAGNDVIDGAGGVDRIRYDRNEVGSVELSLADGLATGYWGTNTFNHTLSNIEIVRGSNLGVDFIEGSSAGGETLEGRNGTDILNGLGGNDTLTGGNNADIFVMEAGSGHDTITDFTLGIDGIGAFGYGATFATAVQSMTFDGTDTQVVFTGGTDSLTIEGIDLSSTAPEEIFAFNRIIGTNGDDELTGTAGNDALEGENGSDILRGGDGSDVLLSGTSPGGYNGEWDQLFGDAGNDILIANQDSFVRLVGGEGDDVIKIVNVSVSDDETKWYEGHVLDYSTSTSGIVANLTSGTIGPLNSGQISDGLGYVDTVDGIQQIADSDFDDVFVIDSQLINKHGANRVEVRLSEGDDSVDFTTSARGRISYRYADDAVDANLATGTAVDRDLGNGDQIGNDTFINATELNGSRYDDLLTGDANNNILQGRQGDDILNGAGGFDTAGHWGTRSRIEVDLNNSTNQIISDGSGGSDTLIDIEQIAGSLFADGIDGSSGADNIQGYAGNDFLNGRAGNDYLSGDYDSGAAGYLGGNDFLAGGTGNDNLHGGDNADVFYFKSGDGFDYIDDFNFGDGDRIDVGEFGYTNTGDFTQFTFNGTDTFVEFDSGTNVTVANVDLTSLVNPNEAFIFNVTNGWVGSSTIGTSGDDHIRPISDNGNNFITATAGDDIIDYTFAQEMFQQLSYSGNTLATDITVTIDAVSNNGNGTVVKGGGVGTDTLFNVLNPLQSGYHSNGGFHIFGTIGDDEFFLDAGEVSWMNVSGLDGNDTFDIDSGLVRLSYSSAFTGINANLVTGTITDGLGGTDTVSGAQGAWEIQGSDFVDTFTGSANDESFITRAGDDIVDGGAGFDRVRYDRPGIGSDAIDANLQIGTVTGQWNGIAFTDTISNIEAVRGGSGNDTITGTTAAEKFQGQDGNDTIIGGGGEDNLYGDGGNDTIVVTDGNYYRADGGDGQDTLVVEGGGQQIDFTLSDAPETWNFENFDLGTGDGSTEVTANEQNVLDVTDEANTAIAAVLGNGDSALLVDGDASDIVNLENSGDISGGSWILNSGDSTTYSGYDVYHYTDTSSTFARIVIDDDIQVVVA